MVGKGPWTNHEDDLLKEHVRRQNGANAWGKVAEALGTRSAKQCRERWHQNLKPGLNHEPITEEESRFIVQMVATRGKRWAEIARAMNGRSDNMIKNWWNGSNNRRQRQQMDDHQDRRRHSAPTQHYPLPMQQPLPEYSPQATTAQSPYPYSAPHHPRSRPEYRHTTSSYSYPSLPPHDYSQPSRSAPTSNISSPTSPYNYARAPAGYTPAPRQPYRHAPSLPPPHLPEHEQGPLASPGASSVASSQHPAPSLVYSSGTASAQHSPFASPDTPTAAYSELPTPQVYGEPSTSAATKAHDSKAALPSAVAIGARRGSSTSVGEQTRDHRVAIHSILNPS